jgi:hypothetical protein
MNSQIIPQLVECSAKPTGRLELGEAEHRVVTLLDSSMILLHSVVQILILAVQDFATNDPANCLCVSGMFVCRHP